MHRIMKSYLLLVEKISNTARRCDKFDTDVDIYRSEIHIVQLIGDNHELYISQISKMIGVTKGTVSQIIKRLEAKGLVAKKTDTSNNTRQLVQLTEKGQVAYLSHNRFHQQQHIDMKDFIDSLNAEQLTAIEDFLVHARHMIDGHL